VEEIKTFARLIRDTTTAEGSDDAKFTTVVIVRARNEEQALWRLKAIAARGQELEHCHDGTPVYEVFLDAHFIE
jgi:hypothetical protein